MIYGKGKSWWVFLVALLLFCLPGAGSAAFARSVQKSALTIEIKEKARVRGKKILLADIALITAEPGLAERAGKIRIGFSPRLGMEKMIPAERVKSLIRAQRWIPKDAEIRSGRVVQVLRAGQNVKKEVLMDIFRREMKKRIRGSEFGVSRFRVRGLRPYPEGELSLSVKDNLPGRNAGSVSLTVSVTVDGKLRGKIGLTGWIDRYERVVCARKDLPRNTVLARGDLRRQKLNVSRLPDNILLSMEEAVGKRLTQTVRSGKYLRGSMLGQPPLIKRGSRVNIVARRGSVRVVTKGVARRDGVRGKQIEVKNVSSNKIVVGRVVDARTVEVLF